MHEGDGAYSFLPTLVDNTLTTLKDVSHVSARVLATDMTTICHCVQQTREKRTFRQAFHSVVS